MHPVQATDAIRAAERQHLEYLNHADSARRNANLRRSSLSSKPVTAATAHPVVLAVTALLLMVVLAAVSI